MAFHWETLDPKRGDAGGYFLSSKETKSAIESYIQSYAFLIQDLNWTFSPFSRFYYFFKRINDKRYRNELNFGLK